MRIRWSAVFFGYLHCLGILLAKYIMFVIEVNKNGRIAYQTKLFAKRCQYLLYYKSYVDLSTTILITLGLKLVASAYLSKQKREKFAWRSIFTQEIHDVFLPDINVSRHYESHHCRLNSFRQYEEQQKHRKKHLSRALTHPKHTPDMNEPTAKKNSSIFFYRMWIKFCCYAHHWNYVCVFVSVWVASAMKNIFHLIFHLGECMQPFTTTIQWWRDTAKSQFLPLNIAVAAFQMYHGSMLSCAFSICMDESFHRNDGGVSVVFVAWDCDSFIAHMFCTFSWISSNNKRHKCSDVQYRQCSHWMDECIYTLIHKHSYTNTISHLNP